MRSGSFDGVQACLRRHGGSETDQTDRDLLEQFVAGSDADAFEALVRRHGPLVLSVCRRVLTRTQDIEDAFQATFLVLVRRASSLSRPELLGNWLYGVAYRTALKARANAARRQDHERRAADMPRGEPILETAWQEVRAVLDEELSRLPAKYRAPLVLCYLEGKTNEEAARLLGWPKGSISGRLAVGRQRLRRRLERRGLALSVGLLAFLLGQRARAEIPATLLGATLKSAQAYGSGQALALVVRPPVADLTGQMLHALWLRYLRRIGLTLLAAGLVAVGGILFVSQGLAAPLLDRLPLVGAASDGANTQPADVPVARSCH